MQVTVHGYRHSVYTHILRMGLAEKAVKYNIRWTDPFAPELDKVLQDLHPFYRVPVFAHGDFTLYETAAILRYVDAEFSGPALTPTAAKAIARMTQVIAIADNYAFLPLVCQVFSHRVFRPAAGEVGDEAKIQYGLNAAPKILNALEQIATEGLVLSGRGTTLADIHLAPMIGALVQAPEGLILLDSYPVLSTWWATISMLPGYLETVPGLPKIAD